MSSLAKIVSKVVVTLITMMVVGVSTYAQEESDGVFIQIGDSAVVVVETQAFRTDSFAIIDGEKVKIIQSFHAHELGRNPGTATMYAAILPGLGQIYNHKYWKLPILYGGAAALIYCIHFNNKYLKLYSNAYRDFLIRDPNNKRYMEIVTRAPLTEELVTTTYESWVTTQLSNKKNYYRRYRDLSIFGIIGLYGVQIIDACVDAHFFNFDVSDDLSMHWEPTFSPRNGGYAGASFAINF